MRDAEVSFVSDARRLSLATWEALPVSARIGDRLSDILIAATELRAELQAEGGITDLACITAVIDDVSAKVEMLLRRLAS